MKSGAGVEKKYGRAGEEVKSGAGVDKKYGRAGEDAAGTTPKSTASSKKHKKKKSPPPPHLPLHPNLSSKRGGSQKRQG